METIAATTTGGFAQPVLDAQSCFKALMDCMANPGRIIAPSVDVAPPAPLSRITALVALTLFDTDTPYWLEGSADQKAIQDWMSFHTGAALAPKRELAHFAIMLSPPKAHELQRFALGSQEYPDRSTTLILQIDGFSPKPNWQLSGPGICGTQGFEPMGMPGGFLEFCSENRNHFPRGIDLILTAPDGIAALPRTTKIEKILSNKGTT